MELGGLEELSLEDLVDLKLQKIAPLNFMKLKGFPRPFRRF